MSSKNSRRTSNRGADERDLMQSVEATTDQENSAGENNAPGSFPVRRRRLSAVRILVAFLLVGGGIGLTMKYLETVEAAVSTSPDALAWAAPYADVTVVPGVAFESPGDGVSNVVLAFVVAHRDEACTPAWGGVFDLDAAADSLDLDRRIARLRQVGADAIVSFGGALNDELAVACTDQEALTAAYAAVVTRYEISTIDLDLEGDGLRDRAAHERRGLALAAVQSERVENGHELAIWLTLPVTPNGLSQEGVEAIDATLAAGVDIAGINLMVMNFGEGRGTASALEVTETALDGTLQQLLGAWRRAGIEISPEEGWARLGVTPMIGRNDIVTEVFELTDAEQLVALVESRGLGRLSFWSLNRDLPCGPNDAPISGPSNFCSHVEQDPAAFLEVFSSIEGKADDVAGADLGAGVTILEDDPERSPYPIWESDRAYVTGAKVVLHGYVYEAKWWTDGANPEAPVVNAWDTPWRIVGPVLAQDLVDPTVIEAGLVPDWDGGVTYSEGDQVWIDGSVYEAKWWNEGFQPNRKVTSSAETPWTKLDPEEFLASLESSD